MIELTVRNDGPDAVAVSQVIVNDGFANFTSKYESVTRLAADTLKVEYAWIEGEAYEITLLTSTGGTIAAEIPVAVESPEAGRELLRPDGAARHVRRRHPRAARHALAAAPAALGGRRVIRVLMAFTIGLLLFLIVDALLEGTEVAGQGSQAFGGSLLVYLGADRRLPDAARRSTSTCARATRRRRARRPSGLYLALLVAIGIGLHNLGEGLAIGAAYAAGALALGALLVIGFAIHNTTEGLAVVAPVAREPPIARCGSPASDCSPAARRSSARWIGASAFNGSVVAFLLGVGAGAIAQVIVQLAPFIRDEAGRHLYPKSAAGLIAGIGVLYLTSLLVTA